MTYHALEIKHFFRWTLIFLTQLWSRMYHFIVFIITLKNAVERWSICDDIHAKYHNYNWEKYNIAAKTFTSYIA